MRVWVRLLKLLLPYWPYAVLGVSLSLLAFLANMGLLALSSWFIASMAIAGSIGATMNYALPAAAIRGLALARAGGRYAERLVNHDTTLRILSGLRVWFFTRIEPLAPARLAAHRSGDLLSRIRADVDSLNDFYVRGAVPCLSAALAIGGIAAFLSRFDPRLVWIDLGGLVIAAVLLPLLLGRWGARSGRERVAYAAELRASIVEEVQGMAELVALGAAEDHAEHIKATSRAMDRCQRRLSSRQGAGEAGLAAVSSLAVWAAALVLAPGVLNGSLPGAHLAMLTVFILASFEAVMPIPDAIQRAGEMAAAARRLFELIDARPAVPEPVEPAKRVEPAKAARIHAWAVAGPPARILEAVPALGLSIRDLCFRYSPDQQVVIEGLSLEAPVGSRVALVGPTGIGKSTLVNILLRFWDYGQGTIELTRTGEAPVELRSLPGDEARRLFSVLPQSPYFFHATIRENLLVASPSNRELDEGELLSALETAQLGDFIRRLPDGLDTTVGEGGRELSAGEARRVALAQALLKDAPIYVLDEPTESLDEATADTLLASIAARLRGRTILVISHRARDLSLAEHVVHMPPRT